MTSGSGLYFPAQSGDDITINDVTASLTQVTGDLGLDNASAVRNMGIRFINVGIPKNSDVVSAHMTLTCGVATSNNTCNLIIKGEKNGTPNIFTTYANYIARIRTTASVNWNALPAWVLATPHDTIDVSSIINEIVRLPDWTQGNNIVLFIENNGSSVNATRIAATWDHLTYAKPSLTVRWIVPPAPEVIPTAEITTPSFYGY